MKFKQLALVIGIAALLLYSCDLSGSNHYYPTSYTEPETYDDDNRQFYAQNFSNNQYYLVEATRLVSDNDKCEVWVEKIGDAPTVTQDAAEKIAEKYYKAGDPHCVYERITALFGDDLNISKFGFQTTGGDPINKLETMEFATAFGSGELHGKLTILLLDIKDNYDKDGTYVAGYFAPIQLFPFDSNTPSNECAMIYIDTYPAVTDPDDPLSDDTYSTLAHELQHLMNFVTSLAIRSTVSGGKLTILNQMDTWIDEGLSAGAEYIYADKHNTERLIWYNYFMENEYGLIPEGNNFFVWENRLNEIPGYPAVMDDYSTVYLFFQWLRIQSSKHEGIYHDIILSDKSNYKAVEAEALGISSNWNNLLRDWLAANYIGDSSGKFGYKNESIYDTNVDSEYLEYCKWPESGKNRFSTKTGSYTFKLYPGEAVYTNSDFPPSSPTAPINYASLSSSAVGDTKVSGHEALLTYNTETNNKKGTSSVNVTIKPSIAGGSKDLNPRSLFQVPLPRGPRVVSAGDVRRRNGFKDEFPWFDFPNLQGKRIINGD